MKRIAQFVAVIGAFCLGMFQLAALAQVPTLPGWDLVWNDEFDGPNVDTSAWELLTRKNSFNNEKQYYLPEQISIDNGNLRITATDEPLDGKLYRSGRMWTWGEWSYGRFEARADLPTTQGMWPAIWLVPRGANWPTGGEIDIMENRGSQPTLTSSAYHWGSSVAQHQFRSEQYTAVDNGGSPVNFHDSFHTYAAEWEPGVIRYYVDDNLHMTITESTAPIHSTPKSLVLNLAVGGHFGGDPDGTTIFPQHFDVDYVRVWQREPLPLGQLVNSSFEGSGNGSFDGWTRFSDTGSNVALSSAIAEDGNYSLSLAGQESGGFNWQGVHQGVPVVGGTPLRASIDSFVSSTDSLAGSGNYANMKIEYYNTFGGSHGSIEFISESVFRLADSSSTEDTWTHHDFVTTAPASAVEARMTLIFLQPNDESGSAFFDSALFNLFVPGDYNLDGTVNAADYSVWLDALGQSGPGLPADGNGNGTVDDADYAVWKSHFGDTDGNTSANANSSPSLDEVPEPASLILLALLAAAMIVGQRRLHYPLENRID